ncbi:conserved Plasmodium protein, unknown function [Plasmodium berghei]|uniref:FoP domain-containing protein, putative n=2 Tax=Plasmodium berghei TaxID=5821 RepID=A0A509ANM1_PLABA|nr:FoP domain-containing protein, putative [Plasmodium berghei ANKA]CXI81435.1 conserved Plasmodium protein, unknown function [Plasmodium berghei]SCM25511.1 conserved Plasmodium protein, unknown function [Plasmodium berghei]SCN27389.1 conserved Plasmodium protein, unknown function [Plasmodium berghei]SCO62056.1 conserved Plasmodium protein, unknown function [Plasmodium berghei]SCO63815.1 conserved Plasmodium protein, unknown function [Plasmodium berghei]|eukprot:XP_034423022.1 FoP domain-containing protein, putative [Plasmodium berghei ANKA]
MAKITKIDRKDKIGRKDGISKSRKTGFTKFSYQPTRGKSFKFTPQKKILDVRKHIYKQYGRGNLSMMNRNNFKRGNNPFFFKNKRRIGNKFYDRPYGNPGRETFLKKSRGNTFRKGRYFRGGKKRNNFFKKTQNLHDKIGKLTSKDLDDELDNYMGSSNVKTRLDNDLDSYFKNNGALQVNMNEGFNKMGE